MADFSSTSKTNDEPIKLDPSWTANFKIRTSSPEPQSDCWCFNKALLPKTVCLHRAVLVPITPNEDLKV
jgi:hypothetical protein